MEKKIGLYICKGCDIENSIEIDKLLDVANKEYKIPLCKTHNVLCNTDGINLIKNDINNEQINTIVLAACSPRVKTEEFNFPNKIVERINIREFVAWSQPPKVESTQLLAEDYLRMGITKAQKSNFPEPFVIETSKTILVIGGGITGLTSALGAADAGYDVILIEKSSELGGWARKLYKQLPKAYPFEVLEKSDINSTIEKVKSHDKISVLKSAEVEKISGSPGQFNVLIKNNGNVKEFNAGSIVLAAGWRPYDAHKIEHLAYGKSPNIITNVEMEDMASKGRITRPSDGKEAQKVAFIQCAGSRCSNHLPYCSSFCCLTSLKQAAYVREKNPNSVAYIFYKDMRTPGQYELFYKKMQSDPGIMLTKGKAVNVSETSNGNLYIDIEETIFGNNIRVEADLVVLAIGMIPNTAIEPEILSEWKK
ncbi:MAG: FAD-dependent oxidoreductase, partial [Spirochaetota bacterium]|nr:FAD-dependent oxidoreductase [Spirochaetota bacterium]